MRTIIVLAALTSLAVGPARAEDAKQAIDAANAKFEAAFNKGDAAGVAGSYASDAALLPPGEARVDGRSAIEAYWKGAIDAGFRQLTLKAVEVYEGGDGAAEVGRWTLVGPARNGGSAQMAGKYIVIWRHSGNSWQLLRDMWNDDPATPK